MNPITHEIFEIIDELNSKLPDYYHASNLSFRVGYSLGMHRVIFKDTIVWEQDKNLMFEESLDLKISIYKAIRDYISQGIDLGEFVFQESQKEELI